MSACTSDDTGLHLPGWFCGLGEWDEVSWSQAAPPDLPLTCLWFTVGVNEVEIQHLEDLSSKRLNQVVIMGKRPLETFYRLSPGLKKFVHKMHFFKDSLIFQQFWEEAAQKAGKEYECDYQQEEEDEEEMVPDLDLDEVLDTVIRPCFDSYEILYDDLRSGHLTLAAVDRIFREFTNHPENLRAELNIICGLRPAEDRAWVDQRVQQIQQYHEMHLTFDAAKIIAQVKDSLGLSGDFSILENLLHIVSICDFSSVLSGCWLNLNLSTSLSQSVKSHSLSQNTDLR